MWSKGKCPLCANEALLNTKMAIEEVRCSYCELYYCFDHMVLSSYFKRPYGFGADAAKLVAAYLRSIGNNNHESSSCTTLTCEMIYEVTRIKGGYKVSR